MQIYGMKDVLELANDDFLENAKLLHATQRGLIRKQLCCEICRPLLRLGEIADQLGNGQRLGIACR